MQHSSLGHTHTSDLILLFGDDEVHDDEYRYLEH